MDTHQQKKVTHQLSAKLLKAVLLAACVLGFFLSLIQVFFDAYQSSEALDQKSREMLAMIKEPASRAASRMDYKMAQEVLNGLLEIKSVKVAAIRLDGAPQLAMVERNLSTSRYRLISDLIFEPIRIYKIDLYLNEPKKNHFGELNLAIDTAYYGKDFIQRSIIVVFSGLIRAIAMALMLYLIYSILLTKPLNRLIKHLSGIDPESPGEQQLPIPKGHNDNEIGLWVRTTNNLLKMIEHNFNLRQKAEAQVMRLSQYDYLTRLPNRKTIQKHLKNLIEHFGPRNEAAAILCLGLDDFKSLNAQVNFNAAEHILVKLADRLRNHLNNKAYIGRLGEDQFAIILSHITQPYEAAELAQSMLKQLVRPFEVNDESLTISATVGITLFPDDGQDVDKLLQQSEFAMIMAKSRSNNRYQFYIATIDSEIRQRKKLEMDLHQALEHHELSLVYQPQVDYRTNTLVGAEALLRWKHPEKGSISPDTFIPMAESSLDIIPIGDWVLESACHKLHDWHVSGYPDLRMAINLSAIQLRDKHIVDRVSYLLHKYQLDPGKLELEVTETSILEDIELSKEQLKKIKNIGVILTLDDFGTGYSSLSYLQKFSFDKIKIDKSFVDDVPNNKENMVIVEAIIQLGKSFNIDVLAEGVETLEQERYLIDSGCLEGQGYYYGKPMTDSTFRAYLQVPSPLPGLPPNQSPSP
ncbi:diguanylate cyclase [Endozoicomonas sp. (ex Bugula neritina AB1)]|nr:diguanylate cyclase [Endozoicomonas sp. (ex Bugula neritina AB1)]